MSPTDSLTFSAGYTLTSEGAVGSRLELLRQVGPPSHDQTQVLFRNRRVLAIKAKEEADLTPGLRYGQKRLYDWGAELLRAASSLAPAVLANPLAPVAHFRDLRLSFSASLLARPASARRPAQQEIVLRSAKLTLCAASKPQRGLWQWEHLGGSMIHEDSDIFIADLSKVSDFTDSAAVLGAWRTLRTDVWQMHLERLRALLAELPNPVSPWPA
jgi:hypothetical protein